MSEQTGKAVMAEVRCPTYFTEGLRDAALAEARSHVYAYAYANNLMLDEEIRSWVEPEREMACAAGTIVGAGRVSRTDLRRLARKAGAR